MYILIPFGDKTDSVLLSQDISGGVGSLDK